MKPYLSKLCEALANSMIGDNSAVSLKVHVDGGTVTSSQAVSLGLIVTELVINALKHAFPAEKKDSQVEVSYGVAGDDWTLSISDNGAGKANGGPGHPKPGLGTSIVEALAKQLDARVNVSSSAQGMAISITHAAQASPYPARASALPAAGPSEIASGQIPILT